MNSKITLIILICIFPLNLLFSQSELYFWGYQTKYELTADSLESVLIPKVEDFRLNNAKVAYESYSPITNRKEILLKLNRNSFLENQPSKEFDILPVFRHGDFPLIPTGEIVFKPKRNIDYNRIQEFCDNKITFLRRSKYGTITIKPKKLKEILKISNKIYESGLVEWCEPNFIIEIVKHQVTPTDPLYPQQYYLNQGNYIDINAPEAWELSRGVNEVRVAVIDDGVENHEDLNGRVLTGFTPLDPNGQGAPTNNPPPEAEATIGHGQACAGIIGATHDNNGISGVAPCSQIIPVNIFNSWWLDFNFPEGQRLRWLETPEDIAEAINWAWDEGEADVLSNSWGSANPNFSSGQIIQAIENARDEGRGGLGSIVIFSSGNFNQAFNGVTFPGNVDGVVTVGAINNNGNIWNYSSRGPEMNLVAPSGNTGGNGDITTTDRMGANGYDPGNYTDDFGGTSAAAPQVAGVAALMLSVNPNLTEHQVVNILNNSATDMGANGFDNTYGFGRLDTEAAIEAALPTIIGPDSFCQTEEYSLDIGTLPSGTTVTWEVSPSNLIGTSSGTGTSASIEPASASATGEATITFNISGSCGTTTTSKEIYVGKPYANLNSPPLVCTNQFSDIYTVPESKGAETYRLVSSSPYLTIGGLNEVSFNIAPFQINLVGSRSGNYLIELFTTNDCGESRAATYVTVERCGPGGIGSFTYYPNPASSKITIENTLYEKSEQSFNSFSNEAKGNIVIYDFNGSIVQTEKFDLNTQSFNLDVSKLKPGKYFMKIGAAREEETHQIVIRR